MFKGARRRRGVQVECADLPAREVECADLPRRGGGMRVHALSAPRAQSMYGTLNAKVKSGASGVSPMPSMLTSVVLRLSA